MAENSKLILVGYGELDVQSDIPIVLNFSLADIQDISKRNAAFSKTIILPGSKRNMEILSHLYNVNVDFDTAQFPIDRKIPAYILQNDVVVLQGFFKLQSVKKLSPSDISYDETIEFEAVVFGGQGSFYDYIKDNYLSDIDLSAFNHILNLENILASSAYTYVDGFKYIYQYNTAPYYSVAEMRPSVYVRQIWDRIFIGAGYSYTMDDDFMDRVFSKLLIPFNAKDLKITKEQQLERSAKIGFANGINQIGINTYVGVLPPFYEFTETKNVLNNIAGNAGNSALFLSSQQLPYNNDSDCFFIGALNTYDTTNSYFVCQRAGLYDVNINYTAELVLDFPVDWYLIPAQAPGGGFDIRLPRFTTTLNIEKRVAGGTTWTPVGTISKTINYSDIIPFQTIPPYLGYAQGDYTGEFTIATEPIAVDLAQGDNLRVTIRPVVDTATFQPSSFDPDAEYQVRIRTIGGNFNDTCSKSFFRVLSQIVNVAEGDALSLSQCLPQKTKMSDFVKALIQMFNLYIDVDRDEPTHLLIKPRNVYYDYNNTSVIDWTDKVQYDADYSLELLSELQERTINFTWKTSKDIWNTEYFNDIKLIYGQYLINFDNDFLVGERKIEPIFEPTPLVVNMSPSPLVGGLNMIVPALVFGVDSNPKILVDGGVINTDTTFDIRTADGVLHPVQQYNYAGHFDNPYTPSIDINWNVNEKYLYNEIGDNITLNNLYELYYEDYIDLIQNSKLLTAFLYLNEADISNLRFDVLYWIRDSYWILNKVIDYNINTPGLTKCEFIKTQNVPRVKTTTLKPGIVFPGLPPRPVRPYATGLGKEEYLDNVRPGNTGNVNNGNATKVDGWFNIINIGTTTFNVLGSNNIVGQNVKGGSIVGDRNNVGGDSKSVNIIGDDNRVGAGCERICLINCKNIEIPPGTTDVFLQGLSDRIFEKSNVSFVNEFIYFNEGYKINNSDVVDGGEDIVALCQTQFVDNVIESGLDITCFKGVDGAQVLDGTYDSPYL
jgi:hypothetical protein